MRYHKQLFSLQIWELQLIFINICTVVELLNSFDLAITPWKEISNQNLDKPYLLLQPY